MADDAWREYVLSVTDGDSQILIRAKTGIDQGTISRWLNVDRTRSSVSAETARKFATAYGRPILEVLVNAEVLTEKEAGYKAGPVQTVDDVLTSVLVDRATRIVAELGRRLADGPVGDQGQ